MYVFSQVVCKIKIHTHVWILCSNMKLRCSFASDFWSLGGINNLFYGCGWILSECKEIRADSLKYIVTIATHIKDRGLCLGINQSLSMKPIKEKRLVKRLNLKPHSSRWLYAINLLNSDARTPYWEASLYSLPI